jgi:muconate cycloisomerase
MNQPLRIREAELHQLAIPMRFAFEHAAATRRVADPVLLRLLGEAPHADGEGWGETLARPYVTGETPETVVTDIQQIFLPLLLEFRATSFPEALEFMDALPFEALGRSLNAARSAVELALLDLAGRAFRRRPSDSAGWIGLAGFGAPGSSASARYSGMAVGRGGFKAGLILRGQRLFGLRDFKLKVAMPGWERRLEQVGTLLRAAIERETATLRVDANAGWTADEASAAIPLLEAAGVCAIEQPLRPEDDERLTQLATRTRCDIIADESLVTLDDARRLIEIGGVQVFNIRLAKVGGFMPALRMAHMALTAGRDVQLGCLVGETSLLTAAGRAFLEACPHVRFVEGAFGGWLLTADVVSKPLRFGWGGKLPAMAGFGLGVSVAPEAVRRLSRHGIAIRF